MIIRPIHQTQAGVKISIEAGGKKFSLNCVKLPDGNFAVKRGRFLSEKMPRATLSKIFEISRKWAVANT